MHGINAFPPEILDHILRNVEQPVPAKAYFPQFPLAPLVRVCRAWQPIAERRLYRSVSIGSTLSSFTNFYHADIDALAQRDRAIAYLAMYNDPRCKARGGDVFVRQFRDALQMSPRLGGLVHTLRMKGRIARLDPSRTEDFIDILRLCPNATHVEIQDCHYPARLRAPLIGALRDLQALASLTVRNTDEKDAEHVLGAAELICAAPCWPRLRHLEVNVPRTPPPASAAAEQTVPDVDLASLPAACCPRLREVVLPRARLTADHLRLIRRICGPGFGLRRFEAVVSADDDTLSALRECLIAWGPALHILYLHFAGFPGPTVIVDVLPHLRLVEDLEISSPPNNDSAQTELAAAASRKRWMRVIEAFSDALADPSQSLLPSRCIRRLACRIPSSSFRKSTSTRSVRRARSTCSGDGRRSFMCLASNLVLYPR